MSTDINVSNYERCRVYYTIFLQINKINYYNMFYFFQLSPYLQTIEELNVDLSCHLEKIAYISNNKIIFT
jgi:hypothetical protein